MTNEEIADKLDQMEVANVAIKKSTAVNDVWLMVYNKYGKDDGITMTPADLVALSRKVLEVVEPWETEYRLVKICNGIEFIWCAGTLQECREEYKFCKEQLKNFYMDQWTIEQVTERIVEVEVEKEEVCTTK